MKILRYILFISIGLIVGVFLILMLIPHKKRDPWVIINIKNQSSHKIKEISIENENGNVKYYGLNKKSECSIPISHNGEGTYTINYILDNGTLCKSFYGYVEQGNETTEWITDEGTNNKVFNEFTKCVLH
jgi:hypothetical protein